MHKYDSNSLEKPMYKEHTDKHPMRYVPHAYDNECWHAWPVSKWATNLVHVTKYSAADKSMQFKAYTPHVNFILLRRMAVLTPLMWVLPGAVQSEQSEESDLELKRLTWS
jgi:hypothetical protein